MTSGFTWLNPPPDWSGDPDRLQVRAGAKTDFWRKTHYGFIRDNGHVYGRWLSGDFTAEVMIRGQYATLYDQAGIMVRLNETTWLKTGIEYVHGVQFVSAVVTRDFSDWSVVPLASSPPAIGLRVKREGDGIEIHYQTEPEGAWTMLRLTYLTTEPVLVGVMCAAPDGDGFDVTFENLTLSGTLVEET